MRRGLYRAMELKRITRTPHQTCRTTDSHVDCR